MNGRKWANPLYVGVLHMARSSGSTAGLRLVTVGTQADHDDASDSARMTNFAKLNLSGMCLRVLVTGRLQESYR